MAENSKISQIKLPNGSTYDIKDNTSGYTKNTGTITQVKTTAGAHTTINVSSGAANFNVPTKTSHLTNDSGFLTSFTETDPTVPAWAKAETKPTYSLSEISNTDDLQTIEALSDGPGLLKRYYNGATQSYYWGLDTTHYLTKSDINFTDGTNGFTLTFGDSTQHWVTITPSVAFSELTSTPTTLSGYGITDAYTKTQIDGLVASVLHYKGTKASVANLPTTGNTTGDVWHITADGSEYAWDGTIWQELGTAVDLSGYAQLSGASFTGPVTFGDSISVDEATIGDLVVNGAASFTNNIQANTINGVAVGNSPKFTDTITTVTTTGSGNAITAASASNGAVTLTKGATFLTSYTETDPTVPSWAKAASKPTYTAAEVGALPDTTVIPSKTSDLTNDSGFITTDSDQKLITSQSQSSNTQYYPIFGENTTTASTKLYNTNFRVKYYNSQLTLQLGQKSADPKRGVLQLVSNQANALTSLLTTATADRTYTLPDKTGTIALTSDIPQVYSSTNTGGYLTMATLPIYDGTVV